MRVVHEKGRGANLGLMVDDAGGSTSVVVVVLLELIEDLALQHGLVAGEVGALLDEVRLAVFLLHQ